jgi:hypothetical protein
MVDVLTFRLRSLPVSGRPEMSAARPSFAAWVEPPHTKCEEALRRMRRLIALFALSIVVSGCGERDGQPRLEPLAHGLSDAMQPAAADFKLEIRALDKGGRETLHCVLRNVSIAATPIDVDASTLPWRNADFFEIDAVSADGKVVHRNPWPAELARISAPPSPLTIASGKSIEGEMNLGEMPISDLPRNEDLLLLWSTSIRVFNSDTATELRGATFLKATSPPRRHAFKHPITPVSGRAAAPRRDAPGTPRTEDKRNRCAVGAARRRARDSAAGWAANAANRRSRSGTRPMVGKTSPFFIGTNSRRSV